MVFVDQATRVDHDTRSRAGGAHPLFDRIELEDSPNQQARQLLSEAHTQATEAISGLRELIWGIQPACSPATARAGASASSPGKVGAEELGAILGAGLGAEAGAAVCAVPLIATAGAATPICVGTIWLGAVAFGWVGSRTGGVVYGALARLL